MKCAHCVKNDIKRRSDVCSDCNKLDRCVVCEVFTIPFADILKHHHSKQIQSPFDPNRCLTCDEFEKSIKSKCFLCNGNCDKGKPELFDSVKRYIKRGNICWYCDEDINRRVSNMLSRVKNGSVANET